MILSDLKVFMRTQKRVVLADLVNQFDMDADALRGMLGKWISKGKVRQLSTTAACGTTCCKCDSLLTEIYEWVD